MTKGKYDRQGFSEEEFERDIQADVDTFVKKFYNNPLDTVMFFGAKALNLEGSKVLRVIKGDKNRMANLLMASFDDNEDIMEVYLVIAERLKRKHPDVYIRAMSIMNEDVED